MEQRKVEVPDGYRPTFRQGAFPGIVILEGVTSVTVVQGKREEWTEAAAHFALAKLLEHRDHVDEAIENVRKVISAFSDPEKPINGSG